MRYLYLLISIFVCFESYAVSFDICTNIDADESEIISNDYIFCIERNFVKAQFALGLSRSDLPICRIYDVSVVDLGYIDCLNDNIQTIADKMNTRLGYCPNMNFEQLNQSFVSCMNGKFEKIGEYLNATSL